MESGRINNLNLCLMNSLSAPEFSLMVWDAELNSTALRIKCINAD